ncbi:MAG: hypothetical protein GY856_47915 [bacterium]|nr:hypothetical protein [bacterium]
MLCRALVGVTALAICLAVGPAWAQLTPEDVGDGPALTATDGYTQADIVPVNPPMSWLDFLRQLGLIVFSTPFNVHDGLGDGPFDVWEVPTTAPGHRPTLQGPETLFLRVNGLDSQSCNECHGVVSHATHPPTLGLGGVGGIAQNAMPAATLLDIADTFEDRVVYMPAHDPDLPLAFDGVADYNGRFINPPFLYGGGGVELLAKEMTADLQVILAQAQLNCPAGTEYALVTHGVDFGSIICNIPGVEPPFVIAAMGVDDDLVVKAFGRKGNNETMRVFDREAMKFHFGIQPVEDKDVGWGNDEDVDGVVDELTIFEMSVLHIFDVTNPPPYAENFDTEAEAGFEVFREVGCSDCHIPQIQTIQNFLPLAYPEVHTDPWKNVYLLINLKKFGYDRLPSSDPDYVDQDCLVVPLFSDLKRHDMGPGLKETLEDAGDPANSEFITARLWGIADTGPYLHDGRATTLRHAIEAHGGEAADELAAFLGQSDIDQLRLLHFLRHLRTPDRPNEDLLPLP